MARFEGVEWAPAQMRYGLNDKTFELLEANAKVYAVSKSIFYAMILCFEGIRFFCRRTAGGRLEIRLLNWHKNLERFLRSIAFNLSKKQQVLVPTVEELENVFINLYFKDPAIKPFLEKMADDGAQGYLRPFTLDEEQSMGVTFPGQPAIRAIFSRYSNYLGEPFTGVVIHHLVRAMSCNKTGWLKLGVNYLISLKAVEAASEIEPGAAAALFLDDKVHIPLEQRCITEWDSSCCLFGLRDGTVIKIPESDLILPSVTIQGMAIILGQMGVKVEERNMTYGELLSRVRSGELVVAASIGTAGIMNRCQKLVCVDANNQVTAVHVPDTEHEIYKKLGEVKTYYWEIYKGNVPVPPGMNLYIYSI